MNYPLDILMLPIQLIVAWFTVYYTVIAVFGIWHRKDRDSGHTGSPILYTPYLYPDNCPKNLPRKYRIR